MEESYCVENSKRNGEQIRVMVRIGSILNRVPRPIKGYFQLLRGTTHNIL